MNLTSKIEAIKNAAKEATTNYIHVEDSLVNIFKMLGYSHTVSFNVAILFSFYLNKHYALNGKEETKASKLNYHKKRHLLKGVDEEEVLHYQQWSVAVLCVKLKGFMCEKTIKKAKKILIDTGVLEERANPYAEKPTNNNKFYIVNSSRMLDLYNRLNEQKTFNENIGQVYPIPLGQVYPIPLVQVYPIPLVQVYPIPLGQVYPIPLGQVYPNPNILTNKIEIKEELTNSLTEEAGAMLAHSEGASKQVSRTKVLMGASPQNPHKGASPLNPQLPNATNAKTKFMDFIDLPKEKNKYDINNSVCFTDLKSIKLKMFMNEDVEVHKEDSFVSTFNTGLNFLEYKFNKNYISNLIQSWYKYHSNKKTIVPSYTNLFKGNNSITGFIDLKLRQEHYNFCDLVDTDIFTNGKQQYHFDYIDLIQNIFEKN